MITLKKWLELVDYRITEGSEFYADIKNQNINLYCLSSWNGEQNGYSFFVVFDSSTQDVYCVEACYYKNNLAYRIKDEALDVDNMAWDCVDFINLKNDDDFIQKVLNIKEA